MFGLFVVLSLALGSISKASVNLVQNPGFETGVLDPWTFSNSQDSGSILVVSSVVRSGNFSLFSNSKNNRIFLPPASFTSDQLIAFKFAVYPVCNQNESPIQTIAVRTLQNLETYQVVGFNVPLQPNLWQTVDLTDQIKNLPSGWYLSDVYIGFSRNEIDLNAYYDEFSIEIIPEPSSLSLLLAGGVVLMVGKRRK